MLGLGASDVSRGAKEMQQVQYWVCPAVSAVKGLSGTGDWN